MNEVLHIGEITPEVKKPVVEGAALIEFQDVCKGYHSSQALKNINLIINEGEFVSFVGPSGAGKSTLVKLLVRQEKPDKGAIFVAGRNLSDLRNSELPYYRRKIGVVFQDFKLLPQKTVWENVAFALEVCGATNEVIKKRTEKVLDLVNMGRRKNNYPDELSGGERQRTAVARALIHSPKILIADEPTGNLDPVNTAEIADILNRINQKGTTVLLATHNRLMVDKIAKRVILMKQGRVISDEKIGRYVI